MTTAATSLMLKVSFDHGQNKGMAGKVPLTEDLAEQIGRFNGMSAGAVIEALERGETLYTKFRVYERADMLKNRSMWRKLRDSKALDVRRIGAETGDPNIFALRKFVEDVDYCDAKTEQWIHSIGMHIGTGNIMAATDARFYQHPEYKCLWLR